MLKLRLKRPLREPSDCVSVVSFKLDFPSLGRRSRAGDHPPVEDSSVPQFAGIVDNHWGPDCSLFHYLYVIEFYLHIIIIILPQPIYFLMIIVPDEGIL